MRVEVLASACALSACISVGCAPPSRRAFDPPLALRERTPVDADGDFHDIDSWLDLPTRRPIVSATPIPVEHLPVTTSAEIVAEAADPLELVRKSPLRALSTAPVIYAFRRCTLDCSASSELVLVFPLADRLVVDGASAPPLIGAFTAVRLPLGGAEGVAASVLAEIGPSEGELAPQHVHAELFATSGDPAPLLTLYSHRREGAVERAARRSVRTRLRALLRSGDDVD